MDGFISPERFSELVGLIYDAAIDARCWPIAMEAIRTELNFHNCTLNLQRMPSGEVLINVTTNIPSNYMAMIDDAGSDVIDQWGGIEKLMGFPMDRAAVLTHINPHFDANSSTNAYYVNFAKPQGIVDVLAIGLARSPQALGTIAFGRHERAGPIGEREIRLSTLLIPHLQRAATINQMLETAARTNESFAATLDQLSTPVLLVAADLRIVHANPSAWALIASNGGLRSVNHVLTATSSAVNTALGVAVRQAAQDQSLLARRGLGIPLRGPDGAGAALHVLPLRAPLAPTDNHAVAAVFVAAADTPFVAPSDIVVALFDLTPAEARVFACIAQGETLATTAELLGVKRSTCKSHLLRIYDKMNVSRQADLIHIATALTAPIIS